MSDISTWSSSAASNNAVAPDGAPEGMNPSDVNNTIRENMASNRRQHEDAQWIDLGDTPTYSSTTAFLIPGDVTASYDAGRRIRATDATTLYGTILTSSYSSPNTTVTLTLDSGVLSVSLSAIAMGALSGTNHSIPKLDLTLNDVTVDNLITSGNVDGRDVSADGTKLDTITYYHGRITGHPTNTIDSTSGFTVSRVSTGYYKITHNLGDLDYTASVTATVIGGVIVGGIVLKATTYIDLRFYNGAGSVADCNFDFIIIAD